MPLPAGRQGLWNAELASKVSALSFELKKLPNYPVT